MCKTKMAYVEQMHLHSPSLFCHDQNLLFAFKTDRDYHEWRVSSEGEDDVLSSEDTSRSSQQSFDSGYQSSSPHLSQKSRKSKTYSKTRETLSSVLMEQVRYIQEQEDEGRDKINMSPTEEWDPILHGLSLIEREWEERAKVPFLVRDFYDHKYQDVSPEKSTLPVPVGKSSNPQVPSESTAGCREDKVEVEKQPSIEKSMLLPRYEETVSHSLQEAVVRCPPVVPQYRVVKSAVRYLQETVHQHFSHMPFHSNPVLLGQNKAGFIPKSKTEVASQRKGETELQSREVSQCMTEVTPQSKNKTDPCSKKEASKVLERVAPKSINKLEPQKKYIPEPKHQDVVKAVEPESRSEEGPLCKCDGEVSQPCEHSKELVVRLRRKKDPLSGRKRLRRLFRVYVPEDLEEPPFQYVPEVLPTSASIKGVVPPLQESLMLLGEGLEASSLVAQFEQLYRRKPGLTVTEARRPDNEKKNRYRDISPYDSTRVILTTAPSGDYINASYVNMEVQASGIVNRYIASQGPLAGTCTDFWHMVWEQQSTLIVMLTTVVEQGRVKCHRYWPRLYETVDFGILQVTCNKEEETPGFAFREFTLINTETQEERHITHMQYLAWPDHGVPDDSTEFLNFVTQVRKARAGMVEPTIVHCSAGIGRTGVLILMETAQCLIEANEPIYPLDIVKAMRDQRAMMIQTASQFRFVCEAIHRVYTEELIKPLAEYEQR